MTWKVLQGDVRDKLAELPEKSVQCVVTSPPYWGLRSYLPDGHEDKKVELGLEKTPEEYVANMVEVFRGVWRVLRDDGTVWINLGDSYCSTATGSQGNNSSNLQGGKTTQIEAGKRPSKLSPGLKPKDLVGIPWRVAFALQSDGWWLRSDIIWAKPNPMPESVTDRPTKAHEYIFLLSKSGVAQYWTHLYNEHSGVRTRPEPDYEWTHKKTGEKRRVEPSGDWRKEWKRRNLWIGHDYFYDAEAVKENRQSNTHGRGTKKTPPIESAGIGHRDWCKYMTKDEELTSRNRRTVWTISTQPYPEAHFATFPPKLVEPCVLAGTSPRACEICGAPWERVVEKGKPINQSWAPGTRKAHIEAKGKHGSTSVFSTDVIRPNITTGWQPTCTCKENSGKGRCIVLDPFAGSGTTLYVAEQHGRDSIGIELSPEYCKLINKRMDKMQLNIFKMGVVE